MTPRFVGLAVLATVLTVGVPLFVAKRLHLGPYAESPQTVRVLLGGTVLVAGGRAELWFGGGPTGANFEVSCVGERRAGDADTPCQACRTNVRLIRVDDTGPIPRATFEVTWENQ